MTSASRRVIPAEPLKAARVGIHTPQQGLWIPGSRACQPAPRNDDREMINRIRYKAANAGRSCFADASTGPLASDVERQSFEDVSELERGPDRGERDTGFKTVELDFLPGAGLASKGRSAVIRYRSSRCASPSGPSDIPQACVSGRSSWCWGRALRSLREAGLPPYRVDHPRRARLSRRAAGHCPQEF